MDDLTARQRRILDFIAKATRQRGYPPTVREIGEAVGLTSSSSVHSQLENLQRKGYLHKDPTKPRALGITPANPDVPFDPGIQVPVVGRIAAGAPVLAAEGVESYVTVPTDMAGPGEHFALRVHGDSMSGAAILDGDLVVARRQQDADDGDIVVALLPGPAEEEATVKRLRRHDGTIVLVPENPSFEPFEMTEGRLAGKVVTVLRAI
jgi:repressor LexA